jgi:chromosome segregation ATPase
MKSCEKKVKDLRLTVELVQNDRAQFAHIDDFELEKRAQYISDMRQELEGMQQYFDGDEVKQKMIADERAGLAQQSGALGATNSDEAENTHFIVDKQAEQRMIMQQQDEDLTELGQGVDRLNELSKGINQELQTQNRMLDDLDRDIDEAAEKMNFVMGKLAKLLKTKDTCQICVILGLTFILLVLILLVMYT